MLNYQRAASADYELFFTLMQEETADYLEHSLCLLQMTLTEFKHLFTIVGEVYGIYKHEEMCGFYWVEEREQVLHLHGLLLWADYRNKGIGTEVLQYLQSKYQFTMKIIELGFHQSNQKARKLYEKLGFHIVKEVSEIGFSIMQKQIET